jgi:hypothetical protein
MALCLLPRAILRRCQYLDIWRPFTGWWINWKVLRRKRPWPNKVLSQHFPGEIRKTIKTSAKTVRVLGKIRTQRFLKFMTRAFPLCYPTLWRCINCWDYDCLIIRFVDMTLILILGTEAGCPDRSAASKFMYFYNGPICTSCYENSHHDEPFKTDTFWYMVPSRVPFISLQFKTARFIHWTGGIAQSV